MNLKEGCIDAGGENCPCILAQYGSCIVCPRVGTESINYEYELVTPYQEPKANNYCDNCKWSGTCIYNLYVNDNRQVISHRKSKSMKIIEIKEYSVDLKVLIIETKKGFCQRCQTAGAFVFLRCTRDNEFYDCPVSVLKAEPDRCRIHLAVQGCGPKSRRILSNSEAGGDILVRGVYYNGLIGIKNLKPIPKQTILIAKGVAIAPFRNFLDGGPRYTRYLQNLRIYIDIEKIGLDFLKDYFGDLPISNLQIMELAKVTEEEFRKIEVTPFESKDVNIFAMTSEYYSSLLDSKNRLVKTNNVNMCCGEGICGACTFVNISGQTEHRCKKRQ